MSKDLKDKAIDIKGKKYVLVSDRILYFNENYPDGSIETELLSRPEDEHVVVKAIIYPWDSTKRFVGHSQAIIGDGMVNKTAALENAETSAVGRALAMMGIGVLDSVASADEMNKAMSSTGQKWLASDKQRNLIKEKLSDMGYKTDEEVKTWLVENYGIKDKLTKKDASMIIEDLFAMEAEGDQDTPDLEED